MRGSHVLLKGRLALPARVRRLCAEHAHVGRHPARQAVGARHLHEQPLACVELDVLARLERHRLVQHDRKLALSRAQLRVDHLVARLELVHEAGAIRPEQHAADAAHHLAAEHLGGRADFGWIHEPRRVHLHLVHIDRISADGHRQLHAVARRPHAVGGGVGEEVGSVLGEERRVGVVVGVATGGKDGLRRGQLDDLPVFSTT